MPDNVSVNCSKSETRSKQKRGGIRINRTTEYDMADWEKRICVNANELCSLLGCGRKTANVIADKARARIYIGKRVLFSVDKIKNFVVEETV